LPKVAHYMPIPTDKISPGLTYDDVLLLPAYSEVLPRDVDTRTQLTPEISLNVPVVSAAMDTVTEYSLAIALAAEGGLGILHKNMTIDQQVAQVRRVKRYESGLIVDPITLQSDAPVSEAFKLMADHKIGGIPVVDARRKLVGIVTNRDVRFMSPDSRQPVADLMTKTNLVTTPEGTTLDQAEQVLKQYRIEKLPVVDKNGVLVGLITYKDILKKRNFPNACKDHLGRLRVGAAIGVTPDAMDRVSALLAAGTDVFSIDSAHGHSRGVLETIRQLRKQFPDLQLIGGNVATAAGTAALIEAGVSCVKVGVGPGSICTTRVVTGVVVPQLTAVMEAASVAGPKGIPVIADGGVKQTGDVPKAIAAGADVVMIGNMFAGTDESPGETILYEGRKFKSYRGMGSIEAMQQGSKDRYFQDVEDDIKKLVPEGIVGRVPYKGRVGEVVYQLVGGLRAGMGYCGAADIAALKQARFVQITNAGLRESHPHSIAITREAPNYTR
jgi:IMP dehydrogenase